MSATLSSTCCGLGVLERRLLSEARLSDRRLDSGLESDDAKEVRSVDTLTGSLNFRVVVAALSELVGDGVDAGGGLETEDQE